ncbi:MAG: prefoldin subunit [Nanoarchaeota archaeon]|nr:prefoldin subunit [Nanoarchaeota archaeon]
MKEQNQKIEEMQILEQNLQSLAYQRQAFQMELSETQASKTEIEQAKEDVFKIIGQLMIKSDQKKVLDDLSNKEKLLELRIKSIEKQENSFSENLEVLKEEVLGKREE